MTQFASLYKKMIKLWKVYM